MTDLHRELEIQPDRQSLGLMHYSDEIVVAFVLAFPEASILLFVGTN